MSVQFLNCKWSSTEIGRVGSDLGANHCGLVVAITAAEVRNNVKSAEEEKRERILCR